MLDASLKLIYSSSVHEPIKRKIVICNQFLQLKNANCN
jgi:hypothetical protein